MIRPGPLEIGLVLTVMAVGAVLAIVLITKKSAENKPAYSQLEYEKLLAKGAKMYCRSCGKELKSNPELCPNCGARPLAGSDFCFACGGETNQLSEICVKCGARMTGIGMVSPKSRMAVALFAFFLGGFGAHRFYLEKFGTGILMLLTLGGLGIWALIDFIIAVVGAMKDKDGKLIVNW